MLPQGLASRFTERRGAARVALAQHTKVLLIHVEVAHPQPTQLKGTQASVEEQLDDGDVTPPVARTLRRQDQRVDLLEGQGLDLVGRRDDGPQLLQWRGGQDFFLNQPAKKRRRRFRLA